MILLWYRLLASSHPVLAHLYNAMFGCLVSDPVCSAGSLACSCMLVVHLWLIAHACLPVPVLTNQFELSAVSDLHVVWRETEAVAPNCVWPMHSCYCSQTDNISLGILADIFTAHFSTVHRWRGPPDVTNGSLIGLTLIWRCSGCFNSTGRWVLVRWTFAMIRELRSDCCGNCQSWLVHHRHGVWIWHCRVILLVRCCCCCKVIVAIAVVAFCRYCYITRWLLLTLPQAVTFICWLCVGGP